MIDHPMTSPPKKEYPRTVNDVLYVGKLEYRFDTGINSGHSSIQIPEKKLKEFMEFLQRMATD